MAENENAKRRKDYIERLKKYREEHLEKLKNRKPGTYGSRFN